MTNATTLADVGLAPDLAASLAADAAANAAATATAAAPAGGPVAAPAAPAVPSVLAFKRSLNPGHVLMYSAPDEHFRAQDLLPVLIREEPLRGLNATSKTKDTEKGNAVLQVVESAELRPGHEVLVLKTRLMVNSNFGVPHSCGTPAFAQAHAQAVQAAVQAGQAAELARRYALMVASADWAWRNAMEAEAVEVRVRHRDRLNVVFQDLLLEDVDTFNLDNPAYVAHREALGQLAALLEEALLSRRKRGMSLRIEGVLHMGLGARVHPSQEWASKHAKDESKNRWPDGSGVTRVLAKLPLADGARQAIINDRKAGNRLRAIDTWHGVAGLGAIAVEPYGASSHDARVSRGGANSMFSLLAKVARGATLTADESAYYLASGIRGGVFGG
jgi:CRISPR-associated protein Csy3